MKKAIMIVAFVFSFSLLAQEEEINYDKIRAPAEEEKAYEKEMDIELGMAEEDHEETVDDLEP